MVEVGFEPILLINSPLLNHDLHEDSLEAIIFLAKEATKSSSWSQAVFVVSDEGSQQTTVFVSSQNMALVVSTILQNHSSDSNTFLGMDDG